VVRVRFRGLVEHLAAVRPDVEDAHAAIIEGRVLVDGRVLDNPDARVRSDAPVVVRASNALRGEAKLRGALDAFAVDARGRIALDAGAAAGGFTRVLLERGATRVYAVDAGHGQLLGSLRQDDRVVNLEATNIGDLSRAIVPDRISLVTLDLSYLSLAAAVPQLESLDIADDADIVALVKPMFELGLDKPPGEEARLADAVTRAIAGIGAGPWTVVADIESPVRGTNGAVEFLVHARRGSFSRQ
jgi:23S rRNA (cytidine1920-2'-O)/16S rRNA (cytidine1409-2'-O)-methyltransferase